MIPMARPRGHRLSPAAWDYILAKSGLTLTEVAERAGVQRATLSGLTGGFHRASVPTAHRLAAVFGCDPEVLFPTLRSSTFVEVA